MPVPNGKGVLDHSPGKLPPEGGRAGVRRPSVTANFNPAIFSWRELYLRCRKGTPDIFGMLLKGWASGGGTGFKKGSLKYNRRKNLFMCGKPQFASPEK